MSGWMAVVFVGAVLYGFYTIWKKNRARNGPPTPQARVPDWVKRIFTIPQSPKSVRTILVLWGAVMGALYAYYPGTFKEFFADHWVFLGLPVMLVVLAMAVDMPAKSPATRWIGGALVVCLVVLYVPKALEQVGVKIPWGTIGTNTPRTYDLAPGETRQEMVPPLHDANFNCQGEISFSASWRDDRGYQSVTGTCDDLARGNVVQTMGIVSRLIFRFTGESAGGKVYATIVPR